MQPEGLVRGKRRVWSRKDVRVVCLVKTVEDVRDVYLVRPIEGVRDGSRPGSNRNRRVCRQACVSRTTCEARDEGARAIGNVEPDGVVRGEVYVRPVDLVPQSSQTWSPIEMCATGTWPRPREGDNRIPSPSRERGENQLASASRKRSESQNEGTNHLGRVAQGGSVSRCERCGAR